MGMGFDFLFGIAKEEAAKTAGFDLRAGAGKGNFKTLAYEKSVRMRMLANISVGVEVCCGTTRMAVDYYFKEESTVVEIALGLRNNNTEFEKDIFKALLLKNAGHPVSKLVFLCKPGGMEKCKEPGRLAIMEWVQSKHGIMVEVYNLSLD
ncbi:MAG: hypothetical protein Q8O35_08360 [Humidesulfovibrio sp.]|jgi:hypothetical protein|uniref:hypothetical protein n=1 Tax=Humidesulfovibrio sp. TaxID=2910988 RepID=UPI002735DC2C|nr:hypothetical protein [Humidesulfovibrio sp.]MDP2848192.1 hypothetical protein [Humidesulfovibrio sp.]